MQAIALLRAVAIAAEADEKLVTLAARTSLLNYEIQKTYGG